MRKHCLLLLFLVAVFCSSAQRTQYNFNPGWKVFAGDAKGAEAPGFDDASWKAVTLPYAWNEDEAFQKDIADLSTGIAWYRKRFRMPPSAKEQKVFLEFEGGQEFQRELRRHQQKRLPAHRSQTLPNLAAVLQPENNRCVHLRR